MAFFNQFFPLWALLLSAVALVFNEPFSSLETAIVPLLAGVMFMMGLTLNKEDFLIQGITESYYLIKEVVEKVNHLVRQKKIQLITW